MLIIYSIAHKASEIWFKALGILHESCITRLGEVSHAPQF